MGARAAPLNLCCPKRGWTKQAKQAKQLHHPLCATGGNSKMAYLQMMHTSCEYNSLNIVPEPTARSQQERTASKGRCGVKRGRDVVCQEAAMNSIARLIGSEPNAV